MNKIYIGNYTVDISEDCPVGVSISGGADSALLLYIVMANTKHHVHIYTLFNPEIIEAYESHIDAVVETCSRLTGNTNFTLHKEFMETNEADTVFRYLGGRFETDGVGLIYFGLTKFPPKDVYLKFNDSVPNWIAEWRDEQHIRPCYGMTIPAENKEHIPFLFRVWEEDKTMTTLISDNRIYVPFVNLNKKDIANMYRTLNISEGFKAYRSCENHTHIGSHCGMCWWCGERKWAFGYLE